MKLIDILNQETPAIVDYVDYTMASLESMGDKIDAGSHIGVALQGYLTGMLTIPSKSILSHLTEEQRKAEVYRVVTLYLIALKNNLKNSLTLSRN